jgi:molybdopterin/thiamine biosynthesis adenylyltransferase
MLLMPFVTYQQLHNQNQTLKYPVPVNMSEQHDALKLLRSRGFNPSSLKGGKTSFKGAIVCNGQNIEIELTISDWDFIDYPEIRVLTKNIPGLLGHQTREGILCYFAKDSQLLNRYDPVDAILKCLAQATKVLEDCYGDPSINNQEVISEFPNYWANETSICGIINLTNTKSKSMFFCKSEKAPIPFLICDASEVAKNYFQSWDEKAEFTHFGNCYTLSAKTNPPIHKELPSDAKAMTQLLKSWEQPLYQQFENIILREKDIMSANHALFLIRYPLGEIAFYFITPTELNTTAYTPSPYLTRKPLSHSKYANKTLNQIIHTRGKSIKISRIILHDLGEDFLHGRNIDHPTLRDKKIIIIGCGAIGSHLSNLIASLGGGSGKGHLLLFDDDKLTPGNVGRHLLGVESLFKSKAVEIERFLHRKFPAISVEGIASKFKSIRSLVDADLVIDATGNEAFAEALNKIRIDLAEKASPVLHLWVKGNGECVQGLWCEYQSACYHCLRLDNVDKYHIERFPVLKGDTKTAYRACTTYTPYSITAAINAANLGAEMVSDWIMGNPSPKFRTHYRENTNTRYFKSQNITPLDGCPACKK